MSWIPTATLFAMMLALGMTLRASDFRRLAEAPRAVGFGLAGQLVLLPLIAFALAAALDLPHAFAIGLVLIAACPGGVTSNVLSWLARGDVALSISLTAVSSVVSFATVPWLVALGMRAFGGDAPRIALPVAEMTAALFGTTALPVLLGMAVRRLRPSAAERLHRPLLGTSTLVLLLLIAGLAVSTARSGRDLAGLATQAAPAVLLLVAIATSVAVLGARWLGQSGAVARTLALEIGVQNFNLALVVALSIMDEPRYIGPALLYLPVMLLFAGGVIASARLGGGPGAALRRRW